MPIETEFEPANNLIRITYTGEVRPADILQNTLLELQHPDFHPGMNSLSDFSNVKFVETNFNILNQYKKHMPDIEKARGSCRWAMVSSSLVNFGILRMFEMLNDNNTIQMKVFRNMDEGRKWLQEAAG